MNGRQHPVVFALQTMGILVIFRVFWGSPFCAFAPVLWFLMIEYLWDTRFPY